MNASMSSLIVPFQMRCTSNYFYFLLELCNVRKKKVCHLRDVEIYNIKQLYKKTPQFFGLTDNTNVSLL